MENTIVELNFVQKRAKVRLVLLSKSLLLVFKKLIFK